MAAVVVYYVGIVLLALLAMKGSGHGSAQVRSREKA